MYEFCDHLVNFFNQEDKDFILNYKTQDSGSKLTFLLCLDNCKDLL